MIKIINDFLPKPLFNYLLGVVEHDTLNWNWNDRNLQVNDTTPGGKEVKLGKTLFVDSQLSGMGKEVYDKEPGEFVAKFIIFRIVCLWYFYGNLISYIKLYSKDTISFKAF